MAKQLNALDIHCEFCNAVSPKDVPVATLDRLRLGWERPLKASEISCFLSHATLWERVATGKAPVLILEDDALLSQRLPDFLQRVEVLSDIDHLSLEIHYKKKWLGPSVPVGPEMAVAQMHLDRSGAAAYILWPAGAQRLSRRVAKGEVALADAFMTNEAHWRSFQADPVMALQTEAAEFHTVMSDFRMPSIIQAYGAGNEGGGTASLNTVRFKWRRLLSQWRLGLRKLEIIGRVKSRWPQVIHSDF